MTIFNVVQEDYFPEDIAVEGIPVKVDSFLKREDAEDFMDMILNSALDEVHPGKTKEELERDLLLVEEKGGYWSVWETEDKRYCRATIYETEVW